jgi:Ca2+-binding RTX toxin-like protein
VTDLVTAHRSDVPIEIELGVAGSVKTTRGVAAVGFESANGGNRADTITGTGGVNVVASFGGNDTMNALGGDDTIDGGVGNDTANAGPGHDTCANVETATACESVV